MQVYVCANLSAPADSASRILCASRTTHLYSRPAPSISLNSVSPIQSGEHVCIQAVITHTNATSLTVAQRKRFRYSWSVERVSRPGRIGESIDISGASGVNGLNFQIYGGTLEPDESYTLVFKADLSSAYVSEGSESGVYYVYYTVSTFVSAVVAQISGGSMREVHSSDNLVLDASSSHDPDKAPGGIRMFQWECNGSSACGSVIETSSGEALTVSTAGLAEGTEMTISVIVTFLTNNGTLVRKIT